MKKWWIGLAAVLLLSCCEKGMTYHHYEHISIDGWDRCDTLHFVTEAVSRPGHYYEQVGLRIRGDYPYTAISLIISQQIIPSMEQRIDTLLCNVIDNDGIPIGKGISQYQYMFPLNVPYLKKGEYLRITIRHDMKREILPGVADVGMKIKRI